MTRMESARECPPDPAVTSSGAPTGIVGGSGSDVTAVELETARARLGR